MIMVCLDPEPLLAPVRADHDLWDCDNASLLRRVIDLIVPS